MSEIKKIKEEYLLKLNEDLDQNKLNEIKTELFGKNGVISTKFKQLGSIAENKRKEFASELNYLKNELEELILKKNENIQNKEINKKLENEKIDIDMYEINKADQYMIAGVNTKQQLMELQKYL